MDCLKFITPFMTDVAIFKTLAIIQILKCPKNPLSKESEEIIIQ